MSREIAGDRDSVKTRDRDLAKTRAIKAGFAMAGIGSLILASCGPAQATETATPAGDTEPKNTLTVDPPIQSETYEPTLTGTLTSPSATEGQAPTETEIPTVELPMAIPENPTITPKITKESIDSLLSNEEMMRLAKTNQEILYREMDSKHPISKEFIESDIVPRLIFVNGLSLASPESGFPAMNGDEQVCGLMKKDLVDLMNEAWGDGVSIYVKSGFRNYWEQQYALNKVNGDTSKVALPGQSQHQTGLAIDFSTPENQQAVGLYSGFEGTKADKWLAENAWKYGYVQPYINGHDGINPAAEPHHYLYVGRGIADDYHKLKEFGWEGDIFDLQELIEQVGRGEQVFQ